MYRGRGWRVEKRKVLLGGRVGDNYVLGWRDLVCEEIDIRI